MKEKKSFKENSINTGEVSGRIPTFSIVAMCLAGFFVLWLMVEMGHVSLIDDPVRSAVISTRSAWLTPIMKVITYMGNWQTITMICLFLLIIKKTRITYGVPLSIGALFVSLANKGIKAIVMRPRPDAEMFLIEQGGWSFPSGHAITSMFFFGMLIWLIRRNITNHRTANVLTVLLAIPMILIGISRVYLGVHYPTDVLGGMVMGTLIAVVVVKGWKLVEQKRAGK